LPRLHFLIALAVLAFLAGCGAGGGDPLSRGAYEARFREAIERYQLARESADALGARPSMPEEGTAAKALTRRLRSMADELDALQPPGNVEAAHDSWVQGLRGLSRDLEPLARALVRRDRRTLTRLLRRGLVRAETVKKLALAGVQFRRNGYDLGLRKLRLPEL
jgi:hypothetical protein